MEINCVNVKYNKKTVLLTNAEQILLESVSISEYIEYIRNKCKNELEQNLYIKVESDNSKDIYFYEQNELSFMKRIIKKDKCTYTLFYDKENGLKFTTNKKTNLTEAEYEFFSKEISDFKEKVSELTEYLNTSKDDNLDEQINKLRGLYYAFYNENLTICDKLTNSKVQYMAAILNVLGIDVIGKKLSFSHDLETKEIKSFELESFLNDTFYIGTTDLKYPENYEAECVYTSQLADIIKSSNISDSFYKSVIELTKIFYMGILSNDNIETDDIFKTANSIWKLKMKKRVSR